MTFFQWVIFSGFVIVLVLVACGIAGFLHDDVRRDSRSFVDAHLRWAEEAARQRIADANQAATLLIVEAREARDFSHAMLERHCDLIDLIQADHRQLLSAVVAMAENPSAARNQAMLDQVSRAASGAPSSLDTVLRDIVERGQKPDPLVVDGEVVTPVGM